MEDRQATDDVLVCQPCGNPLEAASWRIGSGATGMRYGVTQPRRSRQNTNAGCNRKCMRLGGQGTGELNEGDWESLTVGPLDGT
jgi:hypothetical protein